MARPPKLQQVDYFPHMCRHGKTLYIVEQKFGNDGYAFWFKLLERLGSENGHFLDTKQTDTWEFLQAMTHVDAKICTEILNLLAKLGAIDNELWSDGVIWSQNFVDNLTHVYNKRATETPKKPSFRSGNSEKSEKVVVSVTEIQQRIGQDRTGQDSVSAPETPEPVYEPETDHLDLLAQNALAQVIAFYPEAGKQIGIADGQASQTFADEIVVADHGPLIRAVKNYAADVAAKNTEPQYVKRIVNFLRDGYWRNFIYIQPIGTGPPGDDREWKKILEQDEKSAREDKPVDIKKLRPAFMKDYEKRNDITKTSSAKP